MLSRIAESLFWIGRYLERAEDTARLLNVTYHTTLESTTSDAAGDPWAELLTLLYLDEEGEGIDRERVARFVAADRSNPGSIASLVGRARDNARGVREWLTTELWEELNSFYLELASMDLVRALEARPYAVCELVRRRCETVIGVATVAMPRTEGYQFMTLGQLLERAGITARLLAVWHRRMLGMGGTAGFVEWTKVLRSASAYEAYLREHHAMFDGSRVIPFLLGARELPRSVLYCLEVAERQLLSLAQGPYGRTSLRAMGRVRSEVEYVEPALAGEELAGYLTRLESAIQELGTLIEADYFRQVDFRLHAFEAS
jgi:uncharacterized alpha-E superfamily protein